MTTELLAPLDLAFWHLESADHPMHLGALAVFTAVGPVRAAEVLELVAARAAGIPRLRMRVQDVLLPVGAAAWAEDTSFDVHRHVRWLPVPEGDFDAGATRIAGELMEGPLERGRPPWEIYVLTPEAGHRAGGEAAGPANGGADDGAQAGGAEQAGRVTVRDAAGESFAVLVKLHHALADGMRAVTIVAGIFDRFADALPGGAGQRDLAAPRPWLPGPGRMAGLARGRIEELGRALGIGASVVRASRLESTPALSAGSSGTRRLATAVLDLEDIHMIRRASGGTTNDILLATVAGALRRWMLGRGEPLPAADPRALVPVSRRLPAGPAGTGNKISAYLVGLPVAEDDPRARLDSVLRTMAHNKSEGPSRGAGAVAVLVDQLPPLAHRFGAPLAGNAARMLFDILVTSVPMPRSALFLAGCPLRAVYPLAPLTRGQSLAVALSTYGGHVQVGLVADGEAVPDLDRLASGMNEEVQELLRITR